MQTLKQDAGVKVILYENTVLKKVYGLNNSGFRRNISAEEIVSREIRALEKLKNIEGIQKIITAHGNNGFISKYIKGISLREYHGVLYESYFLQLNNIIKQCEQLGVYRIGINRSDFIVREDNTPAIVDFGNILFYDDKIASLPGIISIAKTFSRLRLLDIKSRYINNKSQ